MNKTLLDAALAVRAAGVSVLPASHRDKRPLNALLPRDAEGKPTWAPFQQEIADEPTVRGWFVDGLRSLAVAAGRVSGGLLVIDFDDPRFYEAWKAAVGAMADGLVVQRTGREGGGYQVWLRCPEPGANIKLAWVPDEAEAQGRRAAVETRGEGGYALMAPSLHPSGRHYELLSGDFTAIPTVPQAVADALLAAARKLDEAPYTRQQLDAMARREQRAKESIGYRNSVNGQGGVIDEFNRRHDIESVLQANGYQAAPRGMWARPGKDPAFGSVTVREGRSFHHSTNDLLNDGYWHRPFDVYCQYEHGGDCKQAVKAAARLMGIAHEGKTATAQEAVEVWRPEGQSGTPAESAELAPSAVQPAPVQAKPPAAPPRFKGARVKAFRPFPIAVLPPLSAAFVEEGAASLGCDSSYIALPFLAAAAASIGNTRRLRIKRNWTEPPILWTAVVANSGTLKSPAHELAMAALHRRQRKAIKEFKKKLADYEGALEEYKAKLKDWKAAGREANEPRPEPPERPVLERFVCQDITVEALADRLGKAPRGLLTERDELSGLIGSFDAYKGGKGNDVAHWLSMHRGGSLIIDRKTGDLTTIYVPRASVCVAGGIQPKVLRRSLSDQFFDNGFAARLLCSMPPKTPREWSEAEIDPATQQQVDAAFDFLLSLRPSTDMEGEPEPADVEMTPGAKDVFVGFFNAHAREQFEMGDDDLVAAWSKLEAYCPRFALLIHCLRQAEGDPDIEPFRLDERSMSAAVTLTRWFAHETRRVYGAIGETDEELRRRTLVERVRTLGGATTARNLQKHCRRYTTAEDATTDLMGLVAAGMAKVTRPAPSSRGGRPTEVFELVTPPGDEFLDVAEGVDVTETPDTDTPAGVLSTARPETGPIREVSSTRAPGKALTVDETPAKGVFRTTPVDKTTDSALPAGVSVTSTPNEQFKKDGSLEGDREAFTL